MPPSPSSSMVARVTHCCGTGLALHCHASFPVPPVPDRAGFSFPFLPSLSSALLPGYRTTGDRVGDVMVRLTSVLVKVCRTGLDGLTP